MKINILIQEPAKAGEFADVYLVFLSGDGTPRRVKLNIDFQPLYDFKINTKSIGFDFFFISSVVYGIDNLLERYEYSIDAWAREIEVHFPVYNLDAWESVEEDLQETLCFLTGDHWQIAFTKLEVECMFLEKKKRWKSKIPNYDKDNYKFVSLFSGGLDSLIGVIDSLESLANGERGLLVSHFDPTSSGPNADQCRINNYLARPGVYQNNYDWIQCSISLSTRDSSGNELNREPSNRSRSILFIAIGSFLIESISNYDTLIIPENGTISLNFPLTPSRSSTLSTRTTHPHFITSLQKIYDKLSFKVRLINPYWNKTKGEMVQEVKNPTVLSNTYLVSVSCGKRGRKGHWDTKTNTSHCGVCMPCIYRRAALHTLDLDNQTYGIDIFNTGRDVLTITDMPAFADFMKNKLTKDMIERRLLIAGTLDINNIDTYAEVVEKVRTELRDWLSTKGSSSLKKVFGLR